jgi:hypothetical protein
MNNEQEKIEKINYEQIEHIIKDGLNTVMDNDYNFYKGNEIVVTTDIQYAKLKNKKPGCIYIVISFSPASINFHQVVLPVVITVISEQNKLKICKQLLTDFVYLYNQTKADDDKIFMLFNLPSIGTNFQPVYEGFRSILSVDGTFIISESASFFELTYKMFFLEQEFNDDLKFDGPFGFNVNFESNGEYFDMIAVNPDNEVLYYGYNNPVYDSLNGWYKEEYKKIKFSVISDDFYSFDYRLENFLKNNGVFSQNEEEEKVEFINGQLDYSAQTDTQPFYDMNNFTLSETKFSTLSFTITAFIVSDSKFIRDIIKIVFKKESNNKPFNFDLKFLNIENLNDNFKLINFSANQKINDMPMFVATFTN